ncbi:MAG: PAS domain S-box protein [Syntrophales bacterium]
MMPAVTGPYRAVLAFACVLVFAGLPVQAAALNAEAAPAEIAAGILRNFPPEYVTDEKTGKPGGFAVELMDAVAKKAGLGVRYVPFDGWPSLNKALQEGRIDVVPGMGIAEERKDAMDFTAPTDAFHIHIFVRGTTADIRGLDDLRGRNVAVVATNIGQALMQKYGRANPVVFDSLDAALLSLLSGNTDALVYPEPPVLLITRKSGIEERIKPAGEPLLEVKRAIAVGKGKADLRARLDTAVQAVVATPKYRELYARWYGTPKPYWNARRVTIAAAGALALVIVLFSAGHYASIRRLNRELRKTLARQKDVEASLRESETRYRHLVESAHDWIWEVDQNAVYTYASPHIRELLGYEPAEVIGKTPFDFMSAAEARRVRALFEAIAAERRPFRNLENINLHRDGFPVILETNGTPIIDAGGSLRGYRGMDRDISERRKYLDMLHESEERYRLLVELSPEAIVVHSEGTVVYINPAGANLFGAPAPEALLGKPVREFVHPDSWDRFAGRMRQILEKKEHVPPAELLYRRLDGRVFTGESWGVPITFAGKPASLASIRDVTDRKQAEEDRVRLASAIEQSGEIVVMTDRAGSIEYVNPAFSRITGYTAEDAVGKNLAMLKSGRQSEEFYQEMWDTLTGGRTWRGHFVNRKKDGSLFEEEATISPVKNAAGEITHYVAVKRDVTEQLKIEKQLSQAQKMEAIGTMAGGIAHDFNNILGAISGYTELSLAKTPVDSRVKYYLEQIHTAGQRAINLVKQILEFSRQTEKERIPLSLTPLIKEAAKLLREIMPATIEIRLNLRAEADTVLADATQIYQILMNLCTNAYQAMKEKGGVLEILLDGREIGEDPADELRGLSPGRYVALTVRDTGEGIDPVIVKRIFDPFFTTKKIGEGTGLGLSVVHGIVKSYGGKITVESRLGEGSSFHVYFPRIREVREESPREAQRPSVGGQASIMLVDDEAMLASLTKEMLEDRGYAVAALTDSVAALETFRADPGRFDLVITDQTMPEMTGLDFAASITAIRPDIPVILCTGFLDSAIEERTAKAGIRAVVAKPVRMKRLLEMIQDLLNPAMRS